MVPFQHVLKALSHEENIINNDDTLADTLKEGIEQHKNQEYLMCAISKGKLDDKKQWIHEMQAV